VGQIHELDRVSGREEVSLALNPGSPLTGNRVDLSLQGIQFVVEGDLRTNQSVVI
jgi:hypothetical protein